MNFRTTLSTLLLFFSIQLVAQEKEVPLRYNPDQAARFKNALPAGERGGGSLTLPFFDDFSHYSLAPLDIAYPIEWQMWSDNSAYINTTFPVSPLTIGVATLDGLQANGQPYEWDEPDQQAFCDELTSLPIDLSDFISEDTLHLLFHYENGGWGNTTEVYDILYLEFYTPINSGQWDTVWHVAGGGPTTEFTQVFIPITDEIYLQDGFKFRFRNYGRPGGSVDHWHIDYVLLADQINPANFQFDEVGFQYSNNTLLNFGYTSMPWTHYLSNPSSYMADNITLRQRNLGPTENITSQVRIFNEPFQEDPEAIWTSAQDANIQDNDHQEISTTISLNSFEYPDTGSPSEEDFYVQATFAQTDAHLQNDSMIFKQEFSNYYAYDDGSAESGWGLNAAGARAAVRFDCEIPDTLIGVMIHWLPFLNDHSDQSFLLRVYDVNGNIPGTEMNEEDFTFYHPQYNFEGYNPFYYYELETPVALNGPFFLGWIQQSSEEIFIGNDKNTNMNQTQLFYKLGAFSSWTQTSIAGSVLFRPIFANSNPEWVGVDEQVLPTLNFYPNPASDMLTLELGSDNDNYLLEVVDMSGRIVEQASFRNNGKYTLSVASLAEAVYVLRLKNLSSNVVTTARFIKGQ